MDDDIPTDPVERTAKFRAVIKSVTKEAEDLLKKEGYDPDIMGFCHLLWPEIKRILKEKYNIDWKSPAEMDLFVLFD